MCTAQFCTALHGFALSCTVLHCVLHCLRCTALNSCTVLHCIVLSCINFTIFLCISLCCAPVFPPFLYVGEPSCTFVHFLAWLSAFQNYSLCLALSFVVLNCLSQLTALCWTFLHCLSWFGFPWIEPVLRYFKLPCTLWQCLAPVEPSCLPFKTVLHSLTVLRCLLNFLAVSFMLSLYAPLFDPPLTTQLILY
jgi:hypothetical protein